VAETVEEETQDEIPQSPANLDVFFTHSCSHTHDGLVFNELICIYASWACLCFGD